MHHIEPGHALRLVGGQMKKVELATNRLLDIPAASAGAIAPQYPPQRLHLRQALVGVEPGSASLPAMGSGWITYACWDSGATPITRFASTWAVPAAPSTFTNQTVFLFNGIQNTGPNYGILQPVLQYGPSAAGGGNYWSVASWYVTSSGQAFHTTLVRVAVGQSLLGVMHEISHTGTSYNYDSQFQGIANTTLSVQNIAPLHWANETLEAYAIEQKSDYPASPRTAFTGIDIQTGATRPNVTWSRIDQVTDCGQHCTVISNDNPGGEVDLWYRAQSVPMDVLVHLQDIGDRHYPADEFAGTRGQSRRLEGFQLRIEPPIPGLSMRYKAHLQDIGDVPFVNEGQFVGTRGQSRRLEGFAIELTGPNASQYDVSYMAHLQDIADTPFVHNGEFCGTRGQSRRVEGIQVRITRKAGNLVHLDGLVHLQDMGDELFHENDYAGTRGESRRVEGFMLALNPPIPGVSLQYMAHVEGIGDLPFTSGGQFIGTRGQSRRLEGFAIKLVGPNAAQYDVSYMAHLEGLGDTTFAHNGAFCGTRGQSRRVEGLLVNVFHV